MGASNHVVSLESARRKREDAKWNKAMDAVDLAFSLMSPAQAARALKKLPKLSQPQNLGSPQE